MEILNNDFCGTTFETPKGGVLTVGSVVDKEGSSKLYECHCSICNADKEMFPDLFETTKYRLVRDSFPCGCARGYNWSDRQYRLRLKRLGYDVISQAPITNVQQRITIRKDGIEITCRICKALAKIKPDSKPKRKYVRKVNPNHNPVLVSSSDKTIDLLRTAWYNRRNISQ